MDYGIPFQYVNFLLFYTGFMELKDIGLTLAKIRKKTNMSAYELSLRIEKDETYINKFERGKVNATLKTILMICDVLNISPTELFKTE